MRKIKILFSLFLSMFKIGIFTFGGGYAMISILDNEFVVRKKWIDSDEFLDLVAIAESTPGPIAINCSTYIGYKKAGFAGAIFATLGMCLPSFAIIFLVSLFFDKFLENIWFSSAFRGIQVCVIYIIFSAGIRMLKKIKKTAFNVVGISLTFITMLTLSLFAVNFSTVFYILIFAFIGVSVFFIKYIKERKQAKENEK